MTQTATKPLVGSPYFSIHLQSIWACMGFNVKTPSSAFHSVYGVDWVNLCKQHFSTPIVLHGCSKGGKWSKTVLWGCFNKMIKLPIKMLTQDSAHIHVAQGENSVLCFWALPTHPCIQHYIWHTYSLSNVILNAWILRVRPSESIKLGAKIESIASLPNDVSSVCLQQLKWYVYYVPSIEFQFMAALWINLQHCSDLAG